jgi:23S rRNA pseudouridine1911/1915/1917 synthase
MSAYSDLLGILFEDNHILAINKPAGWPTTHFDGQNETIDRIAKAYIKEKYNKPGNVYLGVVHRLDKATSGCVVFARTSKAAARLSEQFRDNAIDKRYWAIISDNPTDETNWNWGDVGASGSLDDYLWHDDDNHLVKVVAKTHPQAKLARLIYHVKNRADGMILLELHPHSGRKHQIRVQLASRGFPILGDKKYGSTSFFGTFIALHARQLTVLHPITGEPICLTAEIPKNWRGRFAYVLN